MQIKNDIIRLLYSDAPGAHKRRIAGGLGPLEGPFLCFLEHEERLEPLGHDELIRLFRTCMEPLQSSEEILAVLRRLSPGGGNVGFRQVNILVDHTRQMVANFLARNHITLDLLPHGHAFGSGGDFRKTSHATTGACIIASSALPICKTGTTNVTASHGSLQIARDLGCMDATPTAGQLNRLLDMFGFAFVPLQALGLPYSSELRVARRWLWREAMDALTARAGSAPGPSSWSEIMRSTPIPLDIFKIVSPNAQVLDPVHHSTGVCHLNMIPYVIGIYLHLNSQGLIVHSYDGIDEISTASADQRGSAPNNVVIHVQQEQMNIAELGPEDLDLARSDFTDLAEEETIAEGSRALWDILVGQDAGPKRDFLVANTSVLLVAGGQVGCSEEDLVARLRAGTRIAEQLIDSGTAGKNFSGLVAALRNG